MFRGTFSAFFLIQILFFDSCEALSKNKVLLVSLDGFRHDYIDHAKKIGVNVTAFETIWKRGFRAMRVKNEFITRTFPNHFSMVTGLHEESHGIVDNSFYDPSLNESFHLKNDSQSNESRWYDVGGEPIWVTNQKNGFHSFVAFWVGSSAAIQGQLPTHYYPKFNLSVPLRTSFDRAFDYLTKEDVNLALVYYHEPDRTGHRTGPSSKELFRVIELLNDDVNYLLQKVDNSSELREQLNIILTSDHGMADVSRNRMIILADLISPEMYFSPGGNVRVLWALWPNKGFTAEEIYSKLNVNKKAHVHVFRKSDIPPDLFYNQSSRIAPVIVYADPGWLIASTAAGARAFTDRGAHGYDPNSTDMSPFLIASGPGIKQQPHDVTIPKLNMVDIYPMICHLLGLENIGPHNGSLLNVRHLLKDKPVSWRNYFRNTFIVVAILIIGLVMAGLYTLYSCGFGRTLPTQKLQIWQEKMASQTTV